MRQFFFFLLCVTMGVMRLSAQTGGTVYDAKTLHSECLKGERKYAIYLPADYNTSERSYPVLYLLHPAGPRGTMPNQQGWINYGQLKQYLDAAIAKGVIAPMIVVTPDAYSEAVLTKWYADFDIYALFKQLPEEKKNEVAWFIACGDDVALCLRSVCEVSAKWDGSPSRHARP